MKLWSEIIAPDLNQTNKSNGRQYQPIVFLHGTGSNARMWKNQLVFFNRLGYPCLSMDLRGHGQTHEPYEKTSLETHLQDVLQTLQSHQINPPFYFVGHSLGAIISLVLAERQPQLVKTIFAAGMPGKIAKPIKKAFKLFINGPMQTAKESDIKNHLGWRERTLIEMPPFTLEQILTHFGDLDFVNSLPKVNCPVHLANGRFDPIALYWHAKQIQKKLPNSTLQIFEWGGHNFMDASSDAFNAWILQYLQS